MASCPTQGSTVVVDCSLRFSLLKRRMTGTLTGQSDLRQNSAGGSKIRGGIRITEWREESSTLPFRPKSALLRRTVRTIFFIWTTPTIFAFFSFLFLQPVRTEEPLSQLTHGGKKCICTFSSLSAVGKVPGDSAESPDPRAFLIFRSERPL